MPDLNATHDPRRKSWVASANFHESAFPIQNLPYGVFSFEETEPKQGVALGRMAPRVGVAIGEEILDLSAIEKAGILTPAVGSTVFDKPDLNAFMALGPNVWSATRAALSDLLEAGNARLRDDAALRREALKPLGEVRLHLPFHVRSFTDFYASKEHATNVGAMFRGPENALAPNWLHLPIAYNGRASTVVVSGTDIRRPLGQIRQPDRDTPSFGASRKLDFELEVGAIVGVPSAMGAPITVVGADRMIFGFVLLNDWSARDIQAWEYQPLGPFQSKAFATTISPWMVTREALEPFRVEPPPRVKPLLPYLREKSPNNFDLRLEVALKPAESAEETIVSRTNFRHMYYSPAQQLTHHAVCGCAMCVGDLLGSGTVSGPEKGSLGSLLELTRNGREPLALAGGVTRAFIEDGDTVIMRGWCQGDGYRIGFGECRGTIRPAPPEPDWGC